MLCCVVMCCVARAKLGVRQQKKREVLIMGPANCFTDADATRRRAEITLVKLIIRTHSKFIEMSTCRSCRLHVSRLQ